MRKYLAVTCCLIPSFLFLFSCSKPKPSFEEVEAIKMLSSIQTNVEQNVSYDQYLELVDDAKAAIDMLKSSEKQNPCVLSAVDKSYAAYAIAGKAWKKKTEATDEKRKADMDLTLNFSLSFAALSIEKANGCYEN